MSNGHHELLKIDPYDGYQNEIKTFWISSGFCSNLKALIGGKVL